MQPVLRDLLAAAVGGAGAFIWTHVLSRLVRSRRLSAVATRKVIHATTAPLFYLTIPLYSPSPIAPFIAATVPVAFSLRLLLAAKGMTSDMFAEAVSRETDKRMSRREQSSAQDARANQVGESTERSRIRQDSVPPTSGEDEVVLPRDAAGGPFWYGIAVGAVTMVGWRNSAATYVALGMLAFGDGFAEIGRIWPIVRWPLPHGWKRKSVGGSIAFVVAGWLGSLGFSRIFSLIGVLLEQPLSSDRTFLIACACALVEILPLEDNISVPTAAFALSRAVTWRNLPG